MLLINADEAAYDEAIIIQSSHISKSRIGRIDADVEVTYTDLGVLGGELNARKGRHLERVIFHLTKTGGTWKIDGLRIPPHISQTSMLSTLRENLHMDKKAGNRDLRLNAAITEISQW